MKSALGGPGACSTGTCTCTWSCWRTEAHRAFDRGGRALRRPGGRRYLGDLHPEWLAPRRQSTSYMTACAAYSASTATPRRPTSPTSGCTRCSTAGRSRRASSRATGSGSTPTGRWGWSRPASRRAISRRFPGDRAIGHVRYSTAGGSHLKNAQPLAVDYARGSIAVAHNGNLTNHERAARAARGARLDLPERERHRGRSSTSSP